MDYDEYRELYSSLKTAKDVQRLSGKYDDRLLDTLFTQKTSREVKKNFYRVKQNSKRMLNEWSKGKSIVSLSEKYLSGRVPMTIPTTSSTPSDSS